ncbi:hypothetical protein BESB_021810 [Besnoitia besnoiti]|uniref:Chromosome III, complete sequence, related n=1 Tax=Besnoitia besnoiti TaxID=94643 RepID=A0A2A9MA40_BESBE|nr:hypothetical protein BESB_021810 [Besnoitia besnoiti]PFH32240.1 hypothetical protein BESB_021810 [Besnoitia besnoiti]
MLGDLMCSRGNVARGARVRGSLSFKTRFSAPSGSSAPATSSSRASGSLPPRALPYCALPESLHLSARRSRLCGAALPLRAPAPSWTSASGCSLSSSCSRQPASASSSSPTLTAAPRRQVLRFSTARACGAPRELLPAGVRTPQPARWISTAQAGRQEACEEADAAVAEAATKESVGAKAGSAEEGASHMHAATKEEIVQGGFSEAEPLAAAEARESAAGAEAQDSQQRDSAAAEPGAALSSSPEAASSALPPEFWDCPNDLLEFLAPPPLENFFSVDGGDLEPEQVREVIRQVFRPAGRGALAADRVEPSLWCRDGAVGGSAAARGEELPPWLKYPEPNALWPNPLLHNHRLKPFALPRPATAAAEGDGEKAEDGERLSGRKKTAGESLAAQQLRANKSRLEHLWKFARSYGVAWDELDAVYIHFIEMRRAREENWEKHRNELLQYASIVAARELKERRKQEIKEAGVDLADVEPQHREHMLLPRSLHRQETRKLFFQWHRSYMGPWRPGGLQKLMKAVVTLRMLQRETNERFLFLNKQTGGSEADGEEERLQREAELMKILKKPAQNRGLAPDSLAEEDAADDVWDFHAVGRKAHAEAAQEDDAEEEEEGQVKMGQ